MSLLEIMIARFRRLPTPLLAMVVFSRFVFGIGLGAVLAAPKKSQWRLIGAVTMIVATIMVLPSAIRILGERNETP